jgi:hypothetical protein
MNFSLIKKVVLKMMLRHILKTISVSVVLIIFHSYIVTAGCDNIQNDSTGYIASYYHDLQEAYNHFEYAAEIIRKDKEDLKIREIDTVKAFLKKIPDSLIIKYLVNKYFKYLNGQVNTETVDIFEYLDSDVLNEILIRTYLLRKKETKILPMISIYWFSYTGKNKLNACIDSLVLHEKDPCQQSLWRAIYLFKGRPWPLGIKSMSCPFVDNYLKNKKQITRQVLQDLYDNLCAENKPGYICDQ